MMTQETEFSTMQHQQNDRSLFKSRLTLIGIIATFVVPLLLAMLLYARLDIWKPGTYVNHGELMAPVEPLGYLHATAGDGKALDLAVLQDKWSLVYLGDGDCSIACQSQLFKMRQSRAMLGRDLVRVQTLYLALDTEAMVAMESLAGEYPALQTGLVTDAARLRNAFSANRSGLFYLIDPHGNLVLQYDGEATTKGVVKDLKRLLKVSNIG